MNPFCDELTTLPTLGQGVNFETGITRTSKSKAHRINCEHVRDDETSIINGPFAPEDQISASSGDGKIGIVDDMLDLQPKHADATDAPLSGMPSRRGESSNSTGGSEYNSPVCENQGSLFGEPSSRPGALNNLSIVAASPLSVEYTASEPNHATLITSTGTRVPTFDHVSADEKDPIDGIANNEHFEHLATEAEIPFEHVTGMSKKHREVFVHRAKDPHLKHEDVTAVTVTVTSGTSIECTPILEDVCADKVDIFDRMDVARNEDVSEIESQLELENDIWKKDTEVLVHDAKDTQLDQPKHEEVTIVPPFEPNHCDITYTTSRFEREATEEIAFDSIDEIASNGLKGIRVGEQAPQERFPIAEPGNPCGSPDKSNPFSIAMDKENLGRSHHEGMEEQQRSECPSLGEVKRLQVKLTELETEVNAWRSMHRGEENLWKGIVATGPCTAPTHNIAESNPFGTKDGLGYSSCKADLVHDVGLVETTKPALNEETNPFSPAAVSIFDESRTLPSAAENYNPFSCDIPSTNVQSVSKVEGLTHRSRSRGHLYGYTSRSCLDASFSRQTSSYMRLQSESVRCTERCTNIGLSFLLQLWRKGRDMQPSSIEDSWRLHHVQYETTNPFDVNAKSSSGTLHRGFCASSVPWDHGKRSGCEEATNPFSENVIKNGGNAVSIDEAPAASRNPFSFIA